MWASPLYIEKGPNGRGAFFVVTTDNDVHAFDETTGAKLWTTNIGNPPMRNGGTPTCGAVHPLGILSTPVIDAASRTIYVAGAIGTTSIQRHEVHALSVDDGSRRKGWPVDVSTSKYGAITFDTVHQNQRGALSLVGGRLYVAYGGHLGDCGDFHGWVMSIDVKDPTKRSAWATGGRGEGIWQAGGLASDGNGVFTTTGNRTEGGEVHKDSEEVARITGAGTRADVFYPRRWQEMDRTDADFSAGNPVYIELPGATPSKMVVAIAKDGHLYLLDAANLGGLGGEKLDFVVAGGAGVEVRAVPTAYPTSRGLNIAFAVAANPVGCPARTAGKRVIMSVRLTPGKPASAAVAWCAPLSGPDTGPIATTTDGRNEPIVWYVDDGRLVGVDGETGEVIYSGKDRCRGVMQWTSPIAVNGRIIAGANEHLCAWSAR
jgi:outer membrane protein assembly factor BamB